MTMTTESPSTSTQVREFRLPDLGEGLTESEIVQWHITEGDTVELNQVIADVETAKAVVELPSPYAGVVVRLHEAAGTVVAVGTPIVSFAVPVAVPASRTSSPKPGAAGQGSPAAHPADPVETPARREPNLVGYGAAVEKGGRPQRRNRTLLSAVEGAADGSVPRASGAVRGAAADTAADTATDTAADTAADTATDASVDPGSGVGPALASASLSSSSSLSARPSVPERPRSTPPVRKLARDLGVPLDGVTGSGPGALITRADVLAALAGDPASSGAPPAKDAGGYASAPSPARSTPTQGETRIPIRGMRKHTAAAMVASAFTAPHATEFLTIDVTPTLELISELRASAAFSGTRITPLTIVAKAVCIAVARNPSLNSSWDEQAQEIVQYAGVNLGIAAATPRGLLVPNIKGADALTLVELARALGTLADAARAGRTPPADLAGGTLSITNIGVFGIDAGTPILNPGEAAILAVGAVRSMPWEYQGAVALRSVLTLSLSFDHRLVDGEQGSRFLSDVGTILRKPAMVLAMI